MQLWARSARFKGIFQGRSCDTAIPPTQMNKTAKIHTASQCGLAGSSIMRALQRTNTTPKSSHGSMRELDKPDQRAVIEFFVEKLAYVVVATSYVHS